MNNTSTITIPASHEGSNYHYYRLADGVVKEGSATAGTLKTHESIDGYLERVGIHNHTFDNGETIEALEAEILTQNGYRAIVSTSLKSLVASIGFAKGLSLAKKGDYIGICPVRSKEPNKHGKFLTFVNLKRFEFEREAWVRLEPSEPEGETLDDKLRNLLQGLKKHPLYSERKNGKDPWEKLEDALLEKGWPSLYDAIDEYQQMLTKVANGLKLEPGADIFTFSDQVYANFMEGLKGQTSIPKALTIAKARSKKDPEPISDENDPFAGE